MEVDLARDIDVNAPLLRVWNELSNLELLLVHDDINPPFGCVVYELMDELRRVLKRWGRVDLKQPYL